MCTRFRPHHRRGLRAAGSNGGSLFVAAALTLLPLSALWAGGAVDEEMTEGEAMSEREKARAEILAKTTERPGGQGWELGTVGGTWLSSINNDPKTFNTMLARDGDTAAVVGVLFDYLADYDPYTREFKPNLASFEVEVDEEADSLTVIYTLRDDLYWTSLADPESRVQVTADDIVFWYDEIDGDQELQQPGYAGQFIEMPDGSEARIEVTRIDDLTVAFHYPRIVANPILSTNMEFGPRYRYEPAKQEGGAEGVLNLFSIDTDPTTIPSIGAYYIAEYEPGVRVVVVRNPNYWKKDEAGVSLPYIERVIYQIVPDKQHRVPAVQGGQQGRLHAAARGSGRPLERRGCRLHRLQRRRLPGLRLRGVQPEPRHHGSAGLQLVQPDQVPPGDERGAQPRPHRQPGVPRAGRTGAALLRARQSLLRRVDPAALQLRSWTRRASCWRRSAFGPTRRG